MVSHWSSFQTPGRTEFIVKVLSHKVWLTVSMVRSVSDRL